MKLWRRRKPVTMPCQSHDHTLCTEPAYGLHFCGEYPLGGWLCTDHATEHMRLRHGY